MSKKTLLERAYLHVNNGGLSFSIVERTDIHKDVVEKYPDDWTTRPRTIEERDAELATLKRVDHHNRRWAFKIEANHFGSHTTYSFPIVPLSVKWIISALERVLARMEAPQELPTDGVEFAFKDQVNVHVDARDGQKVDEYWPVPRVTYSDSASGRG